MNKISKKDLEVAKKDPGVVAVLNFLLPGLGFIYSEELFLAIITMFIWIVIISMAISDLTSIRTIGTPTTVVNIILFYFVLLKFSIAHIRDKNKKQDEQ